MRAIKIEEAYGSGFSYTGGFGAVRGLGGMRGVTRGGFGGAYNAGGPNMMYTYEIKPLNHTLEQIPTIYDNLPQVQIGSVITGERILSNAYPEKTYVKGIVNKIVTSDNGAIKYYIILDEATQTFVKVEPLSVSLIIPDSIKNYVFSDNIQSKRQKIRNSLKENQIVRESLINE